MEITARRIIAWSSNTDLILENSDKEYREKFFISLIKQSNFLSKNLNSLNLVNSAGFALMSEIKKKPANIINRLF